MMFLHHRGQWIQTNILELFEELFEKLLLLPFMIHSIVKTSKPSQNVDYIGLD